LYVGITDFKKGYQPRTNIVKDDKGDLVRDSQSMAMRRKYFSQLLSVQGVNDVKLTEIHTVEPLVPEPSASEVELAIEKLKRHKSLRTDQIQAELKKQKVEQFALGSINLLIPFGIRRNCQRSGRSRSLYLFIGRVIKHIVIFIGAYHFCQLHTKFYPTSCCQG